MVTVAIGPQQEPPAGADVLLWRNARIVMNAHRPDAQDPSRCGFRGCTSPDHYPCFARRVAEEALVQSQARWPGTNTARHDLRSAGVPRPWTCTPDSARRLPWPK